MPELDKWMQWEDSKWHLISDNPSRSETVCGELPQPGTVFTIVASETIPDEGDVCLHCVRWLIMKLREV